MTVTINGTTGIAGTNGSAGTPAVQGEDTNTGIFFPAADTVAVATAGAERVRVDSSGNLLVGLASLPVGNVRGLVYTPADQSLSLWHSTANTGTWYQSFFYNGNNTGRIERTGVTTVAYTTSSDYRLKENVQPMTGALDAISQLNPVTYTWKADGSAGQGFIAHELQAVVPDCVTGEKDAVDAEGNPQYQGVDTSFLVATLVKAIQELTARVAQLEAK